MPGVVIPRHSVFYRFQCSRIADYQYVESALLNALSVILSTLNVLIPHRLKFIDFRLIVADENLVVGNYKNDF